jgi:oligosaccharide repeat unit polymerase
LAPDFFFTLHAGSIILAVIGSFAVGDYLLLTVAHRFRQVSVNDHPAYTPPLGRIRLATISLGLLSTIGSCWNLLAYARHFGGFSELLSAGNAVRVAFGEHMIAVPFAARAMATTGHAGVVLAAVAWSQFGFRVWMLFPFAAILIFAVSLMGRVGLMMVAVAIFMVAYARDVALAPEGLKADLRFFRRLIPVAGALLLTFAIGEVLRAIDGTDLLGGARTLCVYAFGGPSALSRWLESSHVGASLALGAQSFDSVASMLGIKEQLVGVYDDYAALSVRKPELGNIYTIVRPLLEDFGLPGACCFMLCLGAVCGLVFERTRQGRLSARALACALGVYVVFSIITPPTVFTSWLLSLALPPLILLQTSHTRQPLPVDTSAAPCTRRTASSA